MSALLLAYWVYYKSTVIINLAVCLLAAVNDPSSVPAVFATVGLGCSLLFKEFFRSDEYVLYYNLGISKIRLFIFCLSVNICISILLTLAWILL